MNPNAALRRLAAAVALLLVVPAATFLLSAVGRSLQPTSHEPARTLDAIVSWFGALPGFLPVVLLLVFPMVGFTLATAFVWQTWTTDRTVRADTLALIRAGGRFVRRLPLVIAVLVVLFSVLYFAAIVVHAVAG